MPRETPAVHGERSTVVKSAAEPREHGGAKIAAALHEILETLLEHVVEKALEAVVHSHGFGLLLKVIDFVIEFCRMAANADRRQASDEVSASDVCGLAVFTSTGVVYEVPAQS
jgi:hypothetical protein